LHGVTAFLEAKHQGGQGGLAGSALAGTYRGGVLACIDDEGLHFLQHRIVLPDARIRNARPTTNPARDPATPEDRTATLFAAMGLDPEATVYTRKNRPMPVAHGKPITALLC
jgi:hypothetical protein